MQAVHPTVSLKRACQQGIGVRQGYGMRGLARASCLSVLEVLLFFQVLEERRAELHVDHLNPAADAEDGQTAVEGRVKESELKLVARSAGVSAPAFLLLAMEAGVHVLTAGEEHAVKILGPEARVISRRDELEFFRLCPDCHQCLEVRGFGTFGLFPFRNRDGDSRDGFGTVFVRLQDL